jgi:glyoxylase-like metal-dependent hydrolase (beta-lactamase superfamily II)
VLGGDVLFQGSIGRTDLPGSVPSDLRESIEREMFMLPDDMVVWPGHGGPTTIGAEKRANPFVNASGTGLLQREAEG